jgi:hypothetical protein
VSSIGSTVPPRRTSGRPGRNSLDLLAPRNALGPFDVLDPFNVFGPFDALRSLDSLIRGLLRRGCRSQRYVTT